MAAKKIAVATRTQKPIIEPVFPPPETIEQAHKALDVLIKPRREVVLCNITPFKAGEHFEPVFSGLKDGPPHSLHLLFGLFMRVGVVCGAIVDENGVLFTTDEYRSNLPLSSYSGVRIENDSTPKELIVDQAHHKLLKIGFPIFLTAPPEERVVYVPFPPKEPKV